MKSWSFSFSKNPLSMTDGRLAVGTWAMALRTSSEIAVSLLIRTPTTFPPRFQSQYEAASASARALLHHLPRIASPGRDLPSSIALCRDDLLAQALGLLDVKNRLRLVILVKGTFDRFKRIIEIMWLAGFVEQSAINRREAFLGLRPLKRRSFAG
jgi:hypothetical protein